MARLPYSTSSLTVANSLGAAALQGDSAAFEGLVLELRSRCTYNATSRAETQDLVYQLGQAALDGRTEGFKVLEARLRERLAQRSQRARMAPEEPAATMSVEPSFPSKPARIPFAKSAEVQPKATYVKAEEPKGADWSDARYNDVEEGNALKFSSFEEDLSHISGAGNNKTDASLRASLDLASAYVKNYELDKADKIFENVFAECLARGSPWKEKCQQDLATLRFKQNRQPECAELLEELARSSGPHPTLQENLGTVYNSMGDHYRALACFEEAIKLRGGVASREDIWNVAIAKKNMGELNQAVPMMEVALARFSSEEPLCPVTLGKVHDTLAECYLADGRTADAIAEYKEAIRLLAQHVGKRSPLYGAVAEGCSRALQEAGQLEEAFEKLLEALDVQAHMDAIHPTPLYELLQRAEQLTEGRAGPDPRRLAAGTEAAAQRLASRGLDTDASGGVVLQRMGGLMFAAAARADIAGEDIESERLRKKSAEMLKKAKPLLDGATEKGEADLSELSLIAGMQLGLIEARLNDGD